MSDTPDVNKIAADVIVSASERALSGLLTGARNAGAAVLRALSDAYKPYLEVTFNRVRTIRTFLKKNEPVDLLEQYVPATLEVDEKPTSGEDFVSAFVEGGRFVVSGLAGRGKSVFLRFVALSLYHNPQGRIPIFVELRSLNSAGSKEILPFIHAQYRGGTNVPLGSFISGLRRGYFALILDGFDEVAPESRSTIEDQILQIERRFPDCPILVSGRPDERFDSWEHFTTFSVCPMNYYKTRKIIERADYDGEVKREFLARLTKEFFDQHESFLSTPLLAIMLMLTFEDFAEIPSSLHVFYRNAFDTLVRRHDALKSQFLRTMHSGCSAEQFRRLFASFCVLTYSKSKFQFSRDEALEFLASALRQQNVTADSAHVLVDLVESICLLQVEGFEFSFVHRSFQEYFCALFVSQAPSGSVARYLNSTNLRTYDSVLPMLYAMVPERVEAEWVYPALQRLNAIIDGARNPKLELFGKAYSLMNLTFVHGRDVIAHFNETHLSRSISVLNRFYPAHFHAFIPEVQQDDEMRAAERAKILDAFRDLENSGDSRFAGLSEGFEKSKSWKRGELLPYISFAVTASDEHLLRLSGYDVYLEAVAKAVPVLIEEVQKRVERDDEFIREAFGEIS